MARTLYAGAALLPLVDVFCAIDAKTSTELWNRVFCSHIVQQQSLVTVTQLSWVSHEADLSIVLDSGRLSAAKQRSGHIRIPRVAADKSESQDDIDIASVSHEKCTFETGDGTKLAWGNESETNDGEQTVADPEMGYSKLSSRMLCKFLTLSNCGSRF